VIPALSGTLKTDDGITFAGEEMISPIVDVPAKPVAESWGRVMARAMPTLACAAEA
jgi:hypothetical protein